MTTLSVVGLGKLGACTAACLAYRGFEVTGIDVNRNFVDAVNQGKAPVCEQNLQELITAADKRLAATQDWQKIISGSDVTFLIVPTPSQPDGNFSDKYLRDALEHLASALKKTNKETHLFVVTSTVSPQTTEKTLIPLIESVSGRKFNKGFEVCYNPEFIALGSVIKDFLNPDLVLIGQSSPAAGEKLEAIYKTVCLSKPYIARMSLVSAEIAKISLNSYVTMKISFANTLANICESVPGSNVDDITRALGADKRISPYYLRGGLAFGGPCFPRDNRAFAAFAGSFGVDAILAKCTDTVNQMQTRRLVECVLENVSQSNSSSVAVLGLAYKPNTPVIEESPSIKLIEQLLANEVEVIVYDPLAMDSTRAYFGDIIRYASSAKECFALASVCVIATQADEFKSIDTSFFDGGPLTIIDCWRLIDPEKLGPNVRYVSLGSAQSGKPAHHRGSFELQETKSSGTNRHVTLVSRDAREDA
jgi:UDPglucose 6-dehydrogenase